MAPRTEHLEDRVVGLQRLQVHAGREGRVQTLREAAAHDAHEHASRMLVDAPMGL